MANVFGTPVYIYSAEDPANQQDKSETGKRNQVSTMLKDVIKNLQPLEKALASLESAEKALDGTGYEELRKSIQQVTQQVTQKTQEMVAQISGQQAAARAPQAQEQNQSFVPTPGQISGREPLPEQ